MKYYKEETTTVRILESVECDCCHKVYFTNDTHDQFEIQEFLSYYEMGGYGSIFGDGNIIQLDLCQECIKDVLGKYLKINQEGE